MEFRIAPEIFEHFSGMKIVAVIVKGLDNTKDRPAITEMLTEAYHVAGAEATRYGNAQSHPNVLPWAERMRAVGANRKQFPSSIEAMLRRAGKGGEPFRINPLVDFYNAVSFKYLVPAGAFAFSSQDEVIELRMSKEGDTFQALDDGAPEPIPAGEVSYATGNDILTRHFVWRQSKLGLIEPTTANLLLVSEMLGELSHLSDLVLQEFTEGLKEHFGIEAKAQILTEENLSVKG